MRATELGAWGEELAANALRGKGYRILARNFRCRLGEVDVKAEKDGILVFAEVKLRKSTAYGAPREFVTPAKQRKLRMTASFWLAGHPGAAELQPRFDVVEIRAPFGPEGPVRLAHLENAFE